MKMADPIDVKSLVVEAMYKSLDQGERDKLIRDALEHLIAPTNAGGLAGAGRGPSILEEAFRREVASAASAMVRESMSSDPAIQQKIQAAVQVAFEKFFAGTKLADKMADALWRLVDRDR
jgi:hypothetical protein